MSQYQFEQASIEEFDEQKRRYLENLSAPLDGMWESGFLPLADHFKISLNGTEVGYLVLNEERYILQFDAPNHSQAAFASAVETLKPNGAFVSTAEENYLAAARNHKKNSAVNTLMYSEFTPLKTMLPFDPGSKFSVIEQDGLEMAVRFAHETIGANVEWLRGYYGLLINRGELHGLYNQGNLVATGECRVSETQKPYADLGMVVGKEHRGKGIATKILKTLRKQCHQNKLKPICSTEFENKAAQRSIENAGFKNTNKIMRIEF